MSDISRSDKPAFSGSELCSMEAHQIVLLLRKGEVSPEELLEASKARIETVEPHVNAMPITCWDRAKAASQNLDAENKDHPGWMGGLPIGIKDLTPVKGVRTTFGTTGLANFIPDASDPLVERLEARGALVIGKTNTPEFGAGGNTFNDVFGPTLNPWNTKLNAGGSSGGAAVSLATGEVWLSHGSDHGGSLRTPASFCGIVGFRPSPGRAGGSSPDQAFVIEGVQGPMARSVTDCALFLDAMSGHEPRFPISFPAPEIPFREAVKEVDLKPRVAFTTDLNGFAQCDPEVRNHLTAFANKLETYGATVEQVSPDVTNLEATYHTLRGAMWATAAKILPDAVRMHFKETLAENTLFGQSLTTDDIFDAQINRSRLYGEMLSLFENFDVLAMPVVGCVPQPQSEEWVSEIDGVGLPGYMDWLRFAFLATTTGLPAMAVPTGFGPSGLPIGIQLVGKPRGEWELLQIARMVEQIAGGPLSPIDAITV